ncbi:hypothetical protein V6N13_068877 [Hibiscus sabdariffa]|uniref:Clp R domain-containing protein n=1 Tax=Hibiscus sabdariffa TaxID=183260 RepID=A0ABR2QNV9_9ROSI
MFRDSDRGSAALGFGFEPFAVDTLVRSFEEARRLGHNYIGSGHLLLGLLLEGNDGAPVKRALRDQGVDLSSIYRQVVRMVGEGNKVTGATTLGEYGAIKCPEASAEETILTLMGLKEHYEIHHKLSYKDEALYAAAELSDQYISDRFLPDKAIGLLDKAGARVSTRHAELLEIVRELTRELRQIIKSKKEADRSLDLKKFVELHDREMELKFLIYVFHKMNRADKIVKNVDIRGVVSSWTGIPIEKLVVDESDRLRRLRKMEETLRKRVIGQDEAVKAVSYYAYHDLWRLLSKYTLPSFIFYGPTGVGKSELAKALAAYYFGSEEAVIQLDMREFMESCTASKLIGSSPEGGQLTEAVRRRPHSVVLLKGIEKAHADVLNMIRQSSDTQRRKVGRRGRKNCGFRDYPCDNDM